MPLVSPENQFPSSASQCKVVVKSASSVRPVYLQCASGVRPVCLNARDVLDALDANLIFANESD